MEQMFVLGKLMLTSGFIFAFVYVLDDLCFTRCLKRNTFIIFSHLNLTNCFKCFSYTEGSTIDSFCVSDFRAFDQSVGYRLEDAADLSESKRILYLI